MSSSLSMDISRNYYFQGQRLISINNLLRTCISHLCLHALVHIYTGGLYQDSYGTLTGNLSLKSDLNGA